jgi:hypothetical protein
MWAQGDGSMFSNYPKFRKRAATALREILDWPEDSGDPINDMTLFSFSGRLLQFRKQRVVQRGYI